MFSAPQPIIKLELVSCPAKKRAEKKRKEKKRKGKERKGKKFLKKKFIQMIKFYCSLPSVMDGISGKPTSQQ